MRFCMRFYTLGRTLQMGRPTALTPLLAKFAAEYQESDAAGLGMSHRKNVGIQGFHR